MKYIFLYKVNDTDDRDCVKYINAQDFVKGGRVTVHGACYCCGMDDEYDDVTTILTRDEFESVKSGKFDGKTVLDKLMSEENAALFAEIQEQEREYLWDEYSLDEDDVDYIFDNYGLDYRDRGVVGCVFKDSEDCGYEEAYSLGYIGRDDSIMERYFDYARFGEDLVNEDERYLELSDGRVVVLNY